MKRRLALIGILLMVVAAGLVTLPWLLTPASIGAEIEAAVERATGRTLDFAGPPRLSLWPEPVIEFSGVKLSNPPGLFEGQFAAAEVLRLSVAAAPLFRGRVEVKEVVVVRPLINLVIDGEGRSSFAFATGETKGEGENPGKPSALDAVDGLALAPIIIEDAEVRYLDERSGAALAASNVDLALSLPAPGSPIELKGGLVWNHHRLDLALYAKSPERLTTEGSPFDITLAGPLLKAAFSGRAALKGGLELVGKADLSTPSLPDLAAWAGVPLPVADGLQEFSAAGSLDLAGRALRFKDARLTLDRMNGHGEFSIDLAGPRPRIAGNLGVDRIDLNPYIASRSETAKSDGALTAGWSGAPIKLDMLKGLDAELSLAASEIVYGNVVIGRSRLDATLSEGLLDARLSDTVFYGGTASGQIVLDGRGELPSIRGTLKASGIDGGRLLADFAGFDRIAGKAEVDLDLAASGASQRELVSMLKGESRFRFTDGAIRGIDVAAMVNALGEAVLEGWDAAPDRMTRFSLLEASFTLEDGIADIRDLKLLSSLARATGEGSIDLLRQRLDLKARPMVVGNAQKELVGLPVPVVIEGSWSAPKIYPDIIGILDKPEAAYKTLKKLIGKGKSVELDDAAGKVEKAVTIGAGKLLRKAGKKLLKDPGAKEGEDPGEPMTTQ